MSEFLNIEEVARRFKRSKSWFYQNYKKLCREKNFPDPVSLNGYNIQWSSSAVDYWFNTHLSSHHQANDNKLGGSYERLLAANAALL